MKGIFARKPADIGDLRKARETGQKKTIKIHARVDLDPADFEYFANNLLEDYNFIEENEFGTGVDEEGNVFCILVSTKDRPEKIAVNPEGYNYARYAALIL